MIEPENMAAFYAGNVFEQKATFLKPTRILLWGMPSMLLNIISDAIAPLSDMDIVGKDEKAATLLETAERTNADIVILVRKGVGENEGYDELLYRHSRLKVIEISGEGRDGSLYELRPRHVLLGEMSPLRLVDVIREAVNRAAGAEL